MDEKNCTHSLEFLDFFFFFFTSRLNSRSEVACLNYLTFVPDCLLHTAIQVDPEEDHEDDQRAGKPLL